MPRYIPVAKVPEILAQIQGSSEMPYQLDAWQQQWCNIVDEPIKGAAVLSYRWRTGVEKGKNETMTDFLQWLDDCESQGYEVANIKGTDADWSLIDNSPLQIEVAVWLLWLSATGAAEYAWIDQMCVPQDATLAVKMGHVRESLALYEAGQVYVLLAPVVDYATGYIMTEEKASAIVEKYTDEMDSYRDASWLSRSAIKALLVNHSYMRRAWTIQEAFAAENMNIWPLLGEGSLNSYQSLYVVDWPEFNAWNGHPALGPLYLKFGDKAINDYYNGNYTSLIKVLKAHPEDGIGYLAMISKDLMWITMDRNGLVGDLDNAQSAEARAWTALNHQQIMAARCFNPDDKVLALVPMVEYEAWLAATEGVEPEKLVQASFDWAYQLAQSEFQNKGWAIRIFNGPKVGARALDELQPRRNLTARSSVYGTEHGTVTIPPPGNTVDLGSKTFTVESSCIMGHAGNAGNWGGGPWSTIKDALGTDEGFRLCVQWSLEPWREPEELDRMKCGAIVLSDSDGAYLIILAINKGAGGGSAVRPAPEVVDDGGCCGPRPSSSRSPSMSGGAGPLVMQVMEVIDVRSDLLDPLKGALQSACVGEITSDVTVFSPGLSAKM